MHKKYIIGIDIGGTNFRIGLVSESDEVIDFIIKPITKLQSGDFIKNLADEILLCMEKYKDKIQAIGIGFPSSVSKDKKYVYSTPNLKNLDNTNIVEKLEKHIDIPIFINKDVNLLMINDIQKLNISKDKIALGFYIGTGFGNAIYIGGQVLEGKNGVAGELGHIPVMNSTEECSCGNMGCIEMHASGKKLQKILTTHFSETHIEEIFVKHKNHDTIKKFIDTLSLPIATEVNILDPDYIIIAGGVPNMAGFPKEYLNECIHKHARKPFPADNLKILYSEQNQTSGILGAAYYIRSQF